MEGSHLTFGSEAADTAPAPAYVMTWLRDGG